MSNASEPSALATIELSNDGKNLRIAGRVVALSEGSYEGSITIRKDGSSGRIGTTQGGAAHLAAGESATVATTTMNLATGDRLDIRFVVRSGSREIATAQVIKEQ